MKKLLLLFAAILMSGVAWAQANPPTPSWLQTGTPKNGAICCQHPDDGPTLTLKQCRADFAAWDVPLQVTGWTISQSSLPFDELEKRESTLSACGDVAREHKLYSVPVVDAGVEYRSEMDRFEGLGNLYRASKHTRLQHYVFRHGGMEQFLAEDAAGKR